MQRKNGLVVKIPHLEDTREGKKKIWIRLRHENIVPLLRCPVFRPLNFCCFEMRVNKLDLFNAVQQEEYLERPDALEQLKTWLFQVFCGLDFLRNRQLCHMDLKSENVLISKRSTRAMLGDFSFLSQATSRIGQ
ncbi:hypothetical protein AVEN_76535-1 [Araneus ventricosus]|uniref:Protein kinase domain-containing protein n=1 Tax=Araneus ventricosus TaxID=182803 RepID=A0A4Y2CE26_ARAVE|nr:hypothetical protein AVEN_76535-1 [Araneus ventricosus]